MPATATDVSAAVAGRAAAGSDAPRQPSLAESGRAAPAADAAAAPQSGGSPADAAADVAAVPADAGSASPATGLPSSVIVIDRPDDWLFGSAVALSRDDLAIGAYPETTVGGVARMGPGRARMFTRGPTEFEHQVDLAATHNITGIYDAYALRLMIDGDTLVVGAGADAQEVEPSDKPLGAAYVYTRASAGDGVQWNPAGRLRPSVDVARQSFGWSVAISGRTLVVSASEPGPTTTAPAPNFIGSAYVFTSDDGATWSEVAQLYASNGKANDRFAESVAISGDTIVIGAPREDSMGAGVDGDMTNPEVALRPDVAGVGAAYAFVRDGTSFVQDTYLKAADPAMPDNFGQSVAIDRDTIAVGAPGRSSGDADEPADTRLRGAGAVYIFERGAAGWTQTARLQASNPGVGDSFGASVALSGDRLVVGAPNEASAALGIDGDQSDDSAKWNGAAYVFERRAGVWQQISYLKPTRSIQWATFGSSVSITDARVAVGAPGQAGGVAAKVGIGAVYVFE